MQNKNPSVLNIVSLTEIADDLQVFMAGDLPSNRLINWLAFPVLALLLVVTLTVPLMFFDIASANYLTILLVFGIVFYLLKTAFHKYDISKFDKEY